MALEELVEINKNFAIFEKEGSLKDFYEHLELTGKPCATENIRLFGVSKEKDIKGMSAEESEDLLKFGKATVTYSNWLARIPLVDDVYIQAFKKFSGIGLGLDPEPDYNRNLPISCSNYKIIKHIAFKVEQDKVYVFNQRTDILPETFSESKHPMDKLCEDLGLDDWLKLQKLDLSKFTIFSSISYEEFDKRLIALKQVVKKNNCFGFTKYEVNLNSGLS